MHATVRVELCKLYVTFLLSCAFQPLLASQSEILLYIVSSLVTGGGTLSV